MDEEQQDQSAGEGDQLHVTILRSLIFLANSYLLEEFHFGRSIK